jgi:hypothetical protein
MATLSLTDEQVVELVKQLPTTTKDQVLRELNAERDAWWEDIALKGEVEMRRLARERGLNWDSLSEDQRERFVDDLLHEK